MYPEPVERVDPDPRSPWWGEHRSRYRYAAQHVRDRVVLDLACGSGYGCFILANADARLVIGMDIALESAEDRGRSFALCTADAAKIPLQDHSIDVITSFETIEHVEDDQAFVSELRRVITPGGRLFLSTPNGSLSPKMDGRPANPFHVREYEPVHLERLLGEQFAAVHLLGQKTKPYYRVSPFWDHPDVIPRDAATRRRVLLWKAQNRLPFALKEGLSRMLHDRSFFPGEMDWDFSDQHVRTAHALVAVCEP